MDDSFLIFMLGFSTKEKLFASPNEEDRGLESLISFLNTTFNVKLYQVKYCLKTFLLVSKSYE
jgi:hypothetical protein